MKSTVVNLALRSDIECYPKIESDRSIGVLKKLEIMLNQLSSYFGIIYVQDEIFEYAWHHIRSWQDHQFNLISDQMERFLKM